ncbi:hypothetical protein [Nocardioides sp. InS609-2]|uniref:hypothetical protein n=1 Tax=Nocardioides sp. InS609-2 TaxID=2760705 RepID=UPI0020C08B2A|nr:hypothetical protein [Nocardioides sp. InS609-2]
MRARTGVAATIAAFTLAQVLTGCGDDDPAARTQPSESPSTSSGSPSAAASEPPTEAPSVTPAAGPVLKMDVAEVNAPTGWEHEEQLVPLEDGARKSGQRMSLSETPSFGSTVEKIAKIQSKGYGDEKLKRLDDTEIAGIPVFHLVDPGPRGYYKFTTQESFTAVYRDKVIRVLFQLDRDVSEEKRQRLVAEVLASLVWK